jgi:hypothetical protein
MATLWPTKKIERLYAAGGTLSLLGIFNYWSNWFTATKDGLEWLGYEPNHPDPVLETTAQPISLSSKSDPVGGVTGIAFSRYTPIISCSFNTDHGIRTSTDAE